MAHTELIRRGAECINADISVTCKRISSIVFLWRLPNVSDRK